MKPKTQLDTDTPLPQLPLRANYYFRESQLERFSNALADINCWLSGFVAAGGVYSPQSQETLRDLRMAIESIRRDEACGDSESHTKTKT